MFIKNQTNYAKYINELVLKDTKRIDLIELTLAEFKEKNNHLFFKGQIYDAYSFAANLIRKANKRIILIDNYIDDTVLTLLDKRKDGVNATIYTSRPSKELLLDLNKHNAQYTKIDLKIFSKSHDRFLIIDEDVYLIGASIKDLGKKWFGFTLMESTLPEELLTKL